MKLIAKLVTAWTFAAVVAGAARADDKVVRIGFQKYGKLVLLKNKGTLDAALAPLGYAVEWREFPSGPPLLEAILVANDSALRAVADLKGKKVALNKGSNVHYLLVKALERAGVAYSEIQPVFLAPADARAAFERGSVDAWVIWDPFQAAAEAATGARTLADGTGIVANTQFYLGSRAFVSGNAKVVEVVLAQLREIDDWARRDIAAVAAQLSPSIGIPAPTLEVALQRQSYGIRPIDAAALAEQQKIADAFEKLKLLPAKIKVADAVRPRS